MPTYTGIVELSITFPGGSAKGSGNGNMPTLGKGSGGAGYSIQIVQHYFAKKVAHKFACIQLMHTAYKAALAAAERTGGNYGEMSWSQQGVVIRTINCTVTDVT